MLRQKNPPKDLFADYNDSPTLSKAERELLQSIMKKTLTDDLIVNRDKTEETIIN